MHARGLTVSTLNEPNLACPLQTLVGKGWSGAGSGVCARLCLCGGSRRYGWRRTFVRDDILPTRRHLCVFPEQTTPPGTAPVATSLGREQVSKRPRCRVVTQIYTVRTSHVCRILFQAVHTRPPHRAARGRSVRRLGIITIRRRRLRCAPHSPSHTTPTHSPCVHPEACADQAETHT
jgi:hypothetical protein